MKTYEKYLEETGNVHLAYYVEAADILGIKHEILVKSLLAEFRDKNKVWHIINTATPLTTTTSTTICKRKNLTKPVRCNPSAFQGVSQGFPERKSACL